jgi:SH3-like domain-containing protein
MALRTVKREIHSLGPLIPALFIAALLLASAARSEASGPDFYDVTRVRDGHSLRLRAEPSSDAEVLARISSDGSCLQNRGCVGGLTFEEFTTLPEAERQEIERTRPRWCRVDFGALEGWVAGRFLRESSSACAGAAAESAK